MGTDWSCLKWGLNWAVSKTHWFIVLIGVLLTTTNLLKRDQYNIHNWNRYKRTSRSSSQPGFWCRSIFFWFVNPDLPGFHKWGVTGTIPEPISTWWMYICTCKTIIYIYTGKWPLYILYVYAHINIYQYSIILIFQPDAWFMWHPHIAMDQKETQSPAMMGLGLHLGS